MSKTNFIVINGKKYNAATGELIQDSSHTKVEKVVHTSSAAGKSMDGVARRKSMHLPAKHTKKQVQKSNTLMRKAVKKPTERTTKNENSVSSISKPSLQVNPRRVAHAKAIQKSPHIQKYGVIDHRSSVRKSKISELPVQPQIQQAPHPAQHLPARQLNSQQQQTTHSHNPVSAASSVIESALHSAQSHAQLLLPEHAPKKKRLHHKLGISKKVARVATGGLAAILLVGFFALQNIPNLSMRVAAARSGVNSTLPGYTPSGFAYSGPIDYSEGIVTVSFKSNTDERHYTITQQNSAWTSDSLLSEFVASNTEQYQTYLDGRGRTLYIYDKNNATWVQDGIWYKVEGESKLTTDQLARLAGSM